MDASDPAVRGGVCLEADPPGFLPDNVAGVPPVFLRLLLAGALEPVEYADLLVQYREIYAALSRADEVYVLDDALAAFLRTRIRAGLRDLEADLAVLLGPRWSEEAEVLPATSAYSERARAAADRPEGLIAHHLVRYVADRLAAGHIRLALADAYGPLASRLSFHGATASAAAAVSAASSAAAGGRTAGGRAADSEAVLLGVDTPSGWTGRQYERVAAEVAVAGACDRAVMDELGAVLARR